MKHFRKYKVKKKGTKSQALTSLYSKTSVEGRNLNLGWQELTARDGMMSVQPTLNCSMTSATRKVIIGLPSQCLCA